MAYITVQDLQRLQQRGEKITVLTAYDASFTWHLEQAGVEVILVGDSLGMVIQGHDSTLPVTMDDMVYHTAAVARQRQRALLIADLPYHSYLDKASALTNARRLVDEGGADMVKFEGGGELIAIAAHLVENGIPVCGHLGLLPQSVEELGGYRVQGREQAAAEAMIADAAGLKQAGVDMIVLECIPQQLAKRLGDEVDVITIGIGAGRDCSGQVLVLYDLLGITPGKRPRFSRNFLPGQQGDNPITEAIRSYVQDVKSGAFPDEAHSFN